MARCSLNVSHPKFAKLLQQCISADPSTNAGVRTLCDNLAKDHKLCNWVKHPMPGYPQYQDRIWKWDFNPDPSSHSGTRKGWRIYAYVPDPTMSEPIKAIAFFCYDKANQPSGNPAVWIAGALKAFLAEESNTPKEEEEKFRRQNLADRKVISMCYACYETVAISESEAEVDAAELMHQCPARTPV